MLGRAGGILCAPKLLQLPWNGVRIRAAACCELSVMCSLPQAWEVIVHAADNS